MIEAGYRVITYDRRGFGESSKPSVGYDYDTFASDLKAVIEKLELQNLTLIGHSMGTGEIARYIGRYGSENIVRAVMVSPIPPFLLKTADNATGVDQKVFDDMKASIEKDRYAHLTAFLKKFYSAGTLSKDGVSAEKMHADFNTGSRAGSSAFFKSIDSWIEDFRPDVAKIDIPLLIIHGDQDEILPIDATSNVLKNIVGELVVISGGSHGIPWTHHEEVSKAILHFMQANPAMVRNRLVDAESRPEIQ